MVEGLPESPTPQLRWSIGATMTSKQVEEARYILTQHDFEKRYIPSDIRGLLRQIVEDAKRRDGELPR